MEALWRDAGYAARLLRRAPGFTALSTAVLALGIGATSTIFSLLDAALVRPLPFLQPDRLVMLWEHAPRSAHSRVSPLNFLDWSEQQQTFASMAAIAGGGRTLTGTGSAAERVPGQAVTVRFFDVLGVAPLAGRTFSAADAAARANVVVLGERFWKSRFGGDRAIIGDPVTLDGEPFTVIGVVPATFQILFPADLWTIFGPRRSPEQRRQHYMQVIGRLGPGITLEQASADMEGIAARIAAVAPETNQGWGVTVEPLRGGLVGTDLRRTSLLLAGVVGLVLLMACGNVANLLLARALGRARELALRAALGGSRRRLVAQQLVESLVLSAAGGAAGLALSWAAVRAAPSLLPIGTLPGIVLAFDARLAIVAAVITVVTAVLCGLVPAWQAARTSLTQSLGTGGRSATGRAGAVGSALVVGEVAVSVLLLTGAGLLLRTLVAMNEVDPGFSGDGVLTASVVLPLNRYADPERLRRFYLDAERELAALPGVTVAALGGRLPLDGFDIGQGYELVGDPPAERANQPLAHYQIVSGGYFRALRIDLLRGRPFTERDTIRSVQVCIVNEEFVRRHLSGRNPLGARVSVQAMDLRGGPTAVVRKIVGVVRQVAVAPGERERAVEIYVPIAQNPWFTASLVVRTAGDPAAMTAGLRAAIAKVDKDQPVTRVRTMDEVAAESTSQPRFRAQIVGGFAVAALFLAAVGIFGVVAYSVNQRGREFGIRVALGARARDILRLVLGGALVMTALGVAAGLAAAAVLTRFLGTLLFAVRPLDPVTFLATAGILAAASLGACAVPVWRAIQVQPAIALRQD